MRLTEAQFKKTYKRIAEKKKSPVDNLTSTISTGVGGEAIYETFVYIVAKLPGKKEVPSIAEIGTIIQEPEVVDLGRQWVLDVLNSGKKDEIEVLPELIASIGADIKKTPGLDWGPNLVIVHKSVDDYYKATPSEFKTEEGKENTADMIFALKGTVEDILAGMSSGNVSYNSETGDIKAGKSVFKQVSLKKAKTNARIGKLSAFINQRYGQQPMRPTALVREGKISDIITKFKGGLEKLKGLVKRGFDALSKKATKTANTAAAEAEETEINKLSRSIFSDVIAETLLTEGTPIMNSRMRKELQTLYKEIVNGDLVNKEYSAIMEKLLIIEREILEGTDMSDPVEINNRGTDPELDMKFFKKAVKEVMKFKDGEEIPKDLLAPVFKVTVNYASYQTFNAILLDILQGGKDYSSLIKSIARFAGDMKAEAVFGNTKLPLWIVYGMGGGAYNLGTREDYAEETVSELGALTDEPFIVFDISKSKGKEEYNAIYMLLMSGVKEETGQPVYTKIQFINRSGSNFSYKIDAMQEVTL